MSSLDADLFRRFTRSVLAAQATVLKYGDIANAPFGQSTARWRVLFTISSGTTTVAAIARSTGYSRQAVQRLADALVSEGSASYHADTADRRTQSIELTMAGRRTLEQMEVHFDVWAGRLLAQISPSKLAAVTDALGDVTDVLRADMQHMQYMKERK